ncbi:GNAT family N-acetyltransferase [Amaricoccus sp.]|uniref:GNAT family N-acetyltransferase n=1 Tax=Amaricoccus sp. TaxID=1872485 RepID=UPI001B5957E1|nr:GNAT family N-acetyltransferase [Amaricoccus sp.]MBP7241129.1 GNAT family N-acetyltransferase [Amaricoccus sp.]
MIAVRRLDADGLAARLPALADILHACVEDGASVGFLLPFTAAEAAAFWRETVLPPLAARKRRLLVAEAQGRLAGTVQLLHDTPPNQPHRAEVAKLLVHPDHRRRGLARALMAAVEAEARALGRTLLTLDTRTGDAAEPLYAALGFAAAGVLPGWCLDPRTRQPDATTFMYKPL